MSELRIILVGACVISTALLCSCKREERTYRVEPPRAATVDTITLSDLHAGTATAPTTSTVSNEYEENAYALSEGKRLFEQFNCVGCHAHGGGDKGPALMDNKWIYGSEPDQIFATIVQGRPNGMPSFRGMIPDYQVWQLSAYVRSLSGLANKNAAPGRDDHMKNKPPENSIKRQPPTNSSAPPSVEMPQ